MELATYEYAALEEHHCKLWVQHHELRKLASAYNDVIEGLSSYDDQSASTGQLRAEAGHEGLRAKALEADVLRPIIREAGGPQELEKLVTEAHMLRSKVNEVGGLEALKSLHSEVALLRSKQQEHAESRYKMDEATGLRAKAFKYDKLMLAIDEIRKAPIDLASEQVDSMHTGKGPTEPKYSVPGGSSRIEPRDSSIETLPLSTATINPARASRISATPIETDPDRDLYEATPLVTQGRRYKTGSNDIPLGPSHGPGRQTVQAYERATLKRRQHDEFPTNTMKRPRIDLGRASALVQASLVDKSTLSKHDAMQYDWMRVRVSDTQNIRPIANIERQVSVNQLRESPSVASTPVPTAMLYTVSAESRQMSNSQVSGSSGQMSSSSSNHPSRLPMVKTENTEYDQVRRYPMTVPTIEGSNVQHALTVLVWRYPIAVWIGASSPYAPAAPGDMKKAEQISDELGNFLVNELAKYISASNVHLLNAMPPNRDTCVFRYVVDGHRPSGQPQERRACRICSSAWVRDHRPCALLHEIDGIKTIVFLPLRDALRRNVSWHEKRHWVMQAQ